MVPMALLITVLLGFLGYLTKYWNDVLVAQRKDQLDRTNQQLRLLYGPLLAADLAAGEAWITFRKKYRPNISYWNDSPRPTPVEAKAWRTWMKEVFMPLNLIMYKAILEHADLLEYGQMPKCMLKLIAHVSTYKAVLAQWENDEFSEHVAPVPYPGEELRVHVTKIFELLKERQEKLLKQLGN
jgi:hypothetical protein